MSDTNTPNAEVTRLKARVAELEAQVKAKSSDDKDEGSTRRFGDSWSDASKSKQDATNRVIRGATLASAELVRVFADSVSSFADTVITRNDGKGGERTARQLVTRLPEDIAEGFANAVDRLVEAPSKAADRYASAYREGEKSN